MRVCEQLLLCVAPVRAHSEVDDSGLHGGLRPGRAAAEAGGPRAGADLQCSGLEVAVWDPRRRSEASEWSWRRAVFREGGGGDLICYTRCCSPGVCVAWNGRAVRILLVIGTWWELCDNSSLLRVCAIVSRGRRVCTRSLLATSELWSGVA